MEQKLIRVPFEIELAKRIHNGECEGKIVTHQGENVRILCWDKKDKEYPIVGLVDDGTEEYYKSYTNEGVWSTDSACTLTRLNLMLEIPEYMTFKDGDIIAYDNCDTMAIINAEFFKNDSGDICSKSYITILDEKSLQMFSVLMNSARLATEEEKQKFVNILKESKEPKAKEYLKRFFGIEQKKEYDFKPKDWVLGRDDEGEWYLEIFSHKRKNGEFACIGSIWEECIPYNDQTAHLLGTTEDYKGNKHERLQNET